MLVNVVAYVSIEHLNFFELRYVYDILCTLYIVKLWQSSSSGEFFSSWKGGGGGGGFVVNMQLK